MKTFPYLSLTNKESFAAGKTKLVGKLHLDITHFAKLLICLVVKNSHLFLFAFIWNIALMFIPVYNSESYEYF